MDNYKTMPDFKHIKTVKEFDKSYYIVGMPYHIYLGELSRFGEKLKDKFKTTDVYTICVDVTSDWISFTYVHNEETENIHISLTELESLNDVKIMKCYDEDTLRKAIKDAVNTPEAYDMVMDMYDIEDIELMEKQLLHKKEFEAGVKKVKEKLENCKNPFKPVEKAKVTIGKWEDTHTSEKSTTEAIDIEDDDDDIDEEGWHTIYTNESGFYEDDD